MSKKVWIVCDPRLVINLLTMGRFVKIQTKSYQRGVITHFEEHKDNGLVYKGVLFGKHKEIAREAEWDPDFKSISTNEDIELIKVHKQYLSRW